jgi:hypothetical protein
MKRVSPLLILLVCPVKGGLALAGNANHLVAQRAATCWAATMRLAARPNLTSDEELMFKGSSLYYAGTLTDMGASRLLLRHAVRTIYHLDSKSAADVAMKCAKSAVENYQGLTHLLTGQ